MMDDSKLLRRRKKEKKESESSSRCFMYTPIANRPPVRTEVSITKI